MNKKNYMIAGVIALTMTGTAFAQGMDQKRGQHRGMSMMSDMMSMMDTDGNGTIDKSEFEAMLNKRFADTDTNDDGITFEEYSNKAEADRAARAAKHAEMKEKRAQKKAEMAEKRAERMGERMKKRFDEMDADKDGKVSAEEYNAAGERMFERMDRNSDGILNDRHERGDKKHSKKGSKNK